MPASTQRAGGSPHPHWGSLSRLPLPFDSPGPAGGSSFLQLLPMAQSFQFANTVEPFLYIKYCLLKYLMWFPSSELASYCPGRGGDGEAATRISGFQI